MDYLQIFFNGYKNYGSYLWREITHPHLGNYFYWLIAVSLLFFALEVMVPWRKGQPIIRKDFWLDVFYMFFNFFLFSLIIYNAVGDVVVNVFNSLFKTVFSLDLKSTNPMYTWPAWAVLLTGFVVRDFVQWWTHRLLHKVPWLWNFHKVHHSVQQMGFAAHLRYHWMENVVYRTIEYLPLALLGIGLYDFFVIHIFTLSVGHYNHANMSISPRITGGVIGLLLGIIAANSFFDVNIFNNLNIGEKGAVIIGSIALGSSILSPLMKYIFNSPEMHIWHHAEELPKDRQYGINFGLTLAIWDYIFGTAYVPHDGRDIKLGFADVENFPEDFIGQELYGLRERH